MPRFLDPTGRTSYGLALCARCSRKFFLDELYPDPNAPGLMVCIDDLDELDPYRLPARQTEDITLRFTRPDVPLDGHETNEGLLLLYGLIAEGDDVIFLVSESGDRLVSEQFEEEIG